MKKLLITLILFAGLILAACAAPSPPPVNDNIAKPSQVHEESATDTPTEISSGPMPVIIDTDMAVDDWGAILYLLQHKNADVLGISLVGNGEANCDPGVSNILRLVTIADHDPIPVACANPTPMSGENTFPQSWRNDVNNFNGQQSITPATNPANTEDAVVMMNNLIKASDQSVTMIVTGPTTNVAQLIQDYPEVKEKIEHLFVMGGAVETGGNIDSDHMAEWNFFIDPKADNIILNAGIPVTLGSLDFTNNIPFSDELYELMLERQETPAAEFLVNYEKANPWRTNSGIYLWDQATAVMMMNEPLVMYRSSPMCVVEDGPDQGAIIQDEKCPTHQYGYFAGTLQIFNEYWNIINGD